jgi:PAS domain S-box-containing protein
MKVLAKLPSNFVAAGALILGGIMQGQGFNHSHWLAAQQPWGAELQPHTAAEARRPDEVLAESVEALHNTLSALQVTEEGQRQQPHILATAYQASLAHLQAERLARRQAEIALRQRTRQYYHLLHNSQGPICVHDLAGTLHTVNPAAARSLGYEPQECSGKNLQEFLSPSIRPLFGVYLERLRQHRTHDGCIRVMTKTGDERVWTYHSVCLEEAGEPPYVLGYAQDITERRCAERALQRSQRRLWELATHLQERQEAERQHIAREIHDELGQALIGFKMDLAWLAKRLGAAPASCQDHLTSMTAHVEALFETVRRIGMALRPSMLDELGLVAAMEYQLQEARRRTGLAYVLTVPAAEIVIESACATALWRIFQEALTNVIRHAQASTVTVLITQERDGLLLEVVDDGKGIAAEPRARRDALGLLGMRERAALWGGTVTIQGQPGAGTTVTVRMPYHPVCTRGACQ